MNKNKVNLHQDIETLNISRNRFILGLILGLSYAFSFYALLYLTREAFRITLVSEHYDLWIFSGEEVNFYNLIFAFIATIFGQSICFTFWIHRPKRVFGKNNYRKASILNDQSGLMWYFLSWFSKFAVVYAIFFGLMSGFFVFSFYPDYNFLFILIIIVLFFQTWTTIRHIFKDKSLKWFMISIISVSLVSFAFSRVNLIDYKSINETIQQKNIYHKYKLDVPESNIYNRLENLSLVRDIYIVKSKKANNSEKPIIVINSKEIKLKELAEVVYDWYYYYDEFDISKMICQLHIDSEIKMDFIQKFMTELSCAGITRIAFAVTPVNPKYDKRYYRNHAFLYKISNLCDNRLPNLPPPLPPQNILEYSDNIIEIKPLENRVYQVNSTTIIEEDLKETIFQLITKEPNYVINIITDDKSNFATYFNVLESSMEAVNQLRNDYAQTYYAMDFKDLGLEIQREIKWKYPFAVVDEVEGNNK